MTPDRSKDTLFVSNHPFASKMIPTIYTLSRNPETRFITDASLAALLGLLGISCISVDTRANWRHATNKNCLAYMQLLYRISRYIGVNYESISNTEAISTATRHIEQQGNIFIAPSAQSAPDASWRPGIGKIVKQLVESSYPAKLAIVQISEFPPFDHRIIKVGTIKPDMYGLNIPSLSSPEVACALQQEYRKSF